MVFKWIMGTIKFSNRYEYGVLCALEMYIVYSMVFKRIFCRVRCWKEGCVQRVVEMNIVNLIRQTNIVYCGDSVRVVCTVRSWDIYRVDWFCEIYVYKVLTLILSTNNTVCSEVFKLILCIVWSWNYIVYSVVLKIIL